MAPTPQTIMIVGGNAGIGLETTKHILQLSRTAQVFVLGLQKAEDVPFERCTSFPGDITSPEYRKTAVNECIARHGKIDTLVYTAGIITPIERIESLNNDDLKRTFDVNVFGAIAMVRNQISTRPHY